MSVFMKKSTQYLFGASAMGVLALVGCSQPQEDEMPVAKPVVTEIVAFCDDFSLKNRLTDSIRGALLDASLSQLSGLSDLQIQETEERVRRQLMGVDIQLQNVANTETGCTANVIIAPSMDKPDSRIVAQGITYQVVDNKVILDDPNHSAFALAAQSVIEAANQTAVLDPEAAVGAAAGAMIVAKPRVVERSEETASSEVLVDRSTKTLSQPQENENRAQTKPQPKPQENKKPAEPKRESSEPKRENTKPKAAESKPAEPKKAENKERKENTEKAAQKPKPADPKPVPTQKQPVKDKQENKEQKPKQEQKQPPKAAATEQKSELPKAPTAAPAASKANSDSQITIVETNETY